MSWLAEEGGVQKEKGESPAEGGLSQYKIVKKSYILITQKRFQFVKAYTIKKRIAEKEESGLAKMLRPLLARLIGAKE